MDILFIADPLDRFKIYKDTTYAMMAEAARRGHVLYACEPQHLAWAGDGVEAGARRIAIVGDEANSDRSPWYAAEQPEHLPLTHFDAVLMRKDPPFDMEYVNSTWLLEMAERAGARVFNKPQAIRDHSEKLAIAEWPQYVAPTLVTRDAARLRAFHAEHGDVILKPLDGMGGMGVFRVKPDAMNLGSIIEMLSEDGARSVMAQKFIPQITDGDKRILLIGGAARAVFARANPAGNRSARQSGRGRAWPCAAAFRARSRDRGNARRRVVLARPVARRAGRDRRLSHRGQRDEPDVFPRNHGPDRIRRRRHVHRRAGARGGLNGPDCYNLPTVGCHIWGAICCKEARLKAGLRIAAQAVDIALASSVASGPGGTQLS